MPTPTILSISSKFHAFISVSSPPKDGRISTEEFKQAVQKTCVGKKYEEFPQVSAINLLCPPKLRETQATSPFLSLYLTLFRKAMKAFIEANFKMIDIDGDGIVGAKEYRYNCITRIAVDNIDVVDQAFNKLLDVIHHRERPTATRVILMISK